MVDSDVDKSAHPPWRPSQEAEGSNREQPSRPSPGDARGKHTVKKKKQFPKAVGMYIGLVLLEIRQMQLNNCAFFSWTCCISSILAV